MNLNEDRFCKPYITEDIIIARFRENASWVKENIFEGNTFREKFDTQKKLSEYFKRNPTQSAIQKELFNLLSNIILLKDKDNPHQYHFRIGMQETSSFKSLPVADQQLLNELYRQYFYENQNELWYKEAQGKLDAIQQSTDMLICAEDLGMVPDIAEEVLKAREILLLQVQRMPKSSGHRFADPANAPYLSVVTPSTHDMNTLRGWWEEDRENVQYFYNHVLGYSGITPFYGEPWICKEIILQHLQSPAMWSVFMLQDIMAMNGEIRRENPLEERINNPADPDHYWNYRMHITLEELLKQQNFAGELKSMILESGR